MAIDVQFLAAVDNRLERGKQCGNAGLVVEVAGADMAAFGELRQRIEGHHVADMNAQRLAIGLGRAVGVQTQLDMVPTDRHFIDLGVERMPGRHQRQHAAANHPSVGKQADPAALGKTARPATDRGEGQATVVFHRTHGGADGVQVRRHCAVRAALFALQRRANRAAPGHFKRNAQLFETLGDVAHDGVGEPGRAGNGEHFQQDFLQVSQIRFRDLCGHGHGNS